jgi:hypothetical protein
MVPSGPPKVLVSLKPEVGGDEVVHEAALVGGREPVVAADRELVLLRAPDLPLGGHDRAVLAH